MKHIGEELDKILKERKIKKKDFAAQLGMAPENLSKIFKKESIAAELLGQIAELLGISVSYFFDEKSDATTNIGHKVIGQGNQVGDILFSDRDKQLSLERKLERAIVENEFLRQEIADKKSLLEEKERYIKLLLEQLKHD